NADVLEEVVGELGLPGPPVRLPVVDDTDAEAAGVHFLAHYATASFLRRRVLAAGFDSSAGGVVCACVCLRARRRGCVCSSCSTSTSVTWQVRLRMRLTRPRARGFQRFSVGPSSAYAASIRSSSPSSP